MLAAVKNSLTLWRARQELPARCGRSARFMPMRTWAALR